MSRFQRMLLFSLCVIFVRIVPADAAPLCADLFSIEESEGMTTTLEKQARGLIDQYKTKFASPESRIRRIRYSQMKKAVDHVTDFLRKINTNSYPFVYMQAGYVQQIRLWVKTGKEDDVQSMDTFIKRYKDYPMNRRLLIERTAFIRTQFDYLNSLLKLPDNHFPVSIEIPQAIQRGTLTEKLVLNSKNDVRREIAVLKANEGSRFNNGLSRKFSRGAFFRGREREQAQLEQILTIAYRELKKFPLALRDQTKRAELISELEKILADPELQTTSEARYVESRRQFTGELLYFTGKREFEGRGQEFNDKIWLNDKNDLGIDSERLGPVSRLGRLMLATVPLQALGALIISVTPIVHQEIKQTLFREAYMEEIAQQEDVNFEKSAYAFLKDQGRITFKNGQWIVSAQAKTDLEHLRELHAEFKQDAQKEHESVASFKKLLMGDKKPLMSDEQFKQLMSLDEQHFQAQAKEAAKSAVQNNNQIDLNSTMYRLYRAYTVYHEELQEKEEGDESSEKGIPPEKKIADALSKASISLLAEPAKVE
jgi:hypothetical protein